MSERICEMCQNSAEGGCGRKGCPHVDEYEGEPWPEVHPHDDTKETTTEHKEKPHWKGKESKWGDWDDFGRRTDDPDGNPPDEKDKPTPPWKIRRG